MAVPIDLAPARERITGTPQMLSIPSGNVTLYIIVIGFIMVGSALMLIPGFHADVTQDETDYQAAAFAAEYSDEHDLSYPKNYVFSDWSVNRMHNYVVSGYSHSYHFARHNYRDFLLSNESVRWYEQLSERTGFIITVDQGDLPAETMQTRLHDNYGSRTAETEALEHYRAVYTIADGEQTVFVLVPGATVRWVGAPNESKNVSTTVTLPPDGTEITYEQGVQSNEQGEFVFTTPYPGTYKIGNRTVEITEDAVENGRERRLNSVENEREQ